EVIRLEQQDDKTRLLDNLPRSDVTVGIRHTVGDAVSIRPILAVVPLTFLINLLRPRLHLDLNAIRAEILEIFGIGTAPDSRKIRRTIRQLRRRSREVGLSISGSRDARIRVVQPLRIRWHT